MKKYRVYFRKVDFESNYNLEENKGNASADIIFYNTISLDETNDMLSTKKWYLVDEEMLKNKNIEHSNKVYDLSKFYKDYPEVANLLLEMTRKQYEIIDYINKGENK